MSHKDQSGFILMAVAIIVTIGLLGLVGWSLYNTYYSKQNSVTTSTNQNPKPTISSPSNSTTAPQPQYLYIKEFGIKITLNNQISDAVYAMVKDQPGNGFTLVGISAQSLIDNETKYNNDCIAADAPLGSISASTTPPTSIANQQGMPVDNTALFKYGDTYYHYSPPQGNYQCGITSSGTQDSAVSDKMSAFKQAFTTAQPYSATLDIKELGIKITLSDQIDDAVYSVRPVASDGTRSVNVSAQSLLDKSSYCTDALGLVIDRNTAPTYINSQQTLPIDNKYLFKFGDAYYQYIPPQNQGCLTTSKADGDLILSKIRAFAQAFTTAQPDK